MTGHPNTPDDLYPFAKTKVGRSDSHGTDCSPLQAKNLHFLQIPLSVFPAGRVLPLKHDGIRRRASPGSSVRHSRLGEESQ